MLLSAVSVLVVAQSISEVPEGLMNNPVYFTCFLDKTNIYFNFDMLHSLNKLYFMTETL